MPERLFTTSRPRYRLGPEKDVLSEVKELSLYKRPLEGQERTYQTGARLLRRHRAHQGVAVDGGTYGIGYRGCEIGALGCFCSPSVETLSEGFDCPHHFYCRSEGGGGRKTTPLLLVVGIS